MRDVRLAMRRVRGAIIALNNKEKSCNENSSGVSVNIYEVRQQRSGLMDEYLRLHKIWFKGTTRCTR